MNLNFEIKVECKGSAVGTLGWLNEKLSKTELVIKNNKAGNPAMFAIQKINGGKDDATFICRVAQPEDYTPENGIRYLNKTISNTELLYVCPVDNQYCHSFVDCTLTPSAYEKAEEFINHACKSFVEWWEKS